ncbi:beta-1,6-N-acetylglucosaminyltransferase [Epilithonimonas pallida]|nr:beta-1,6-N-acetylglucosaminyltransferase [Epilithonimonas pallida]SMP85916.1 Core-2/I-Branching enzyme [Epilithonimonas pallida]
MQNYFSSTQPQPQTSQNQNDKALRIAYFIMVHNETEKFIILFKKIYTRDQFYLIHIDRKAKPEITEAIQLFLIQFPNAFLLESMNITSGGFSIVQAELNAMEFLLNASPDWDYFINLSCDDFPLKSQNIIRKFLSENNGKNYLFYYDQKFYRPDTLQRIQNHFTEMAYKISSFIYKREFMKNVIPFIGGKWFLFTRDTCAFLNNNKKVMLFEEFYINTYLPGESFFQTVLMNTDFHDVIVNDDKRAVLEKSLLNKINPDAIINYLRSNNHLFIRKIDGKTDKSVLQYIEENYNTKLPDIDEIERELRINDRQNN